jgi:hypothetical protein
MIRKLDDEPAAAVSIRGFFEAYWARVRQNLWGEVHESVVPVLLGRFDHHITICPDGVLVIMQRASTDAFVWLETSQSILDLAREQLRGTEVWSSLNVGQLQPGTRDVKRFDLDVALRRLPDDDDVPFDRVMLRYIPFTMDTEFWTTQNAEQIASWNLEGPAR